MNAFRCLGLLVFVLLGACDKHQEPVVPKPKTQAAQSAAPAQAPASELVPALPVTPVPVAPMPVAPVVPSTVPSTLDKPVADVVTGSVASKPAAPVHELTPNVPVVPVVIGKGDSGVAPKPADVRSDKGSKVAKVSVAEEKKTAANKPAAKAVSKREEQAQKRQAAKTAAVAKEAGLGKTRLDLSLPPELVQELEPPPKVITARRKPLLPPMFGDKASEGPNGFELNGRLLSNEMQLQMRNDSRRDVEGAALDFKFKQ